MPAGGDPEDGVATVTPEGSNCEEADEVSLEVASPELRRTAPKWASQEFQAVEVMFLHRREVWRSTPHWREGTGLGWLARGSLIATVVGTPVVRSSQPEVIASTAMWMPQATVASETVKMAGEKRVSATGLSGEEVRVGPRPEEVRTLQAISPADAIVEVP